MEDEVPPPLYNNAAEDKAVGETALEGGARQKSACV
jgi:hypothetical protein